MTDSIKPFEYFPRGLSIFDPRFRARLNRLALASMRIENLTCAGMEYSNTPQGIRIGPPPRIELPGRIFAKVTSSTGSPAKHAWTERRLSAAGTFEDMPDGGSGTTSTDSLYTLGGDTIPDDTDGLEIWREFDKNGNPVWVTDYVAGGGGWTRMITRASTTEFEWTIPDGVDKCLAIVTGGGAGGQAGAIITANSGSNANVGDSNWTLYQWNGAEGGSGGGAGETVFETLTNIAAYGSLKLQCGAPGTGGDTTSLADGTDGGSSTVKRGDTDAVLTTAAGGVKGGSGATESLGGGSVSASSGSTGFNEFHTPGGDGHRGAKPTPITNVQSNPGSSFGNNGLGGNGGASFWGGGGRGGAAHATAEGQNGSAFGSGGGGGAGLTGGGATVQQGGDGIVGLIMILY